MSWHKIHDPAWFDMEPPLYSYSRMPFFLFSFYFHLATCLFLYQVVHLLADSFGILFRFRLSASPDSHLPFELPLLKPRKVPEPTRAPLRCIKLGGGGMQTWALHRHIFLKLQNMQKSSRSLLEGNPCRSFAATLRVPTVDSFNAAPTAHERFTFLRQRVDSLIFLLHFQSMLLSWISTTRRWKCFNCKHKLGMRPRSWPRNHLIKK